MLVLGRVPLVDMDHFGQWRPDPFTFPTMALTRRATWGPNCVPQVPSSQGVTWVEWDTLTLKLTARLPLNRCIYLHLVDFYGERKEQQNNPSTKTHKSVSFPSTKAARSKNHRIRSVRTWWRTVCSMKPPGEPRFSTRVDPWKWS